MKVQVTLSVEVAALAALATALGSLDGVEPDNGVAEAAEPTETAAEKKKRIAAEKRKATIAAKKKKEKEEEEEEEEELTGIELAKDTARKVLKAKKSKEMKEILASYDVAKVSDLDPEDEELLESVIEELKALLD